MQPTVISADDLINQSPGIEHFDARFLAEGDSWFTIGTFNVLKTSNLLFGLDFAAGSAVINCAYPGDSLRHIADQLRLQPRGFDGLLRGNLRRPWDAILLSAGGNDLIDAAQIPPVDKHGNVTETHERLLLTPAEAAASGGAGGDPARYISTEGWQTLRTYFRKNMEALVARRDGPRSQSVGVPLFLHTYAKPFVGNGGVPITAPNGWLLPAFEAAGIPEADRQPVSDRLFELLRDLIIEQGTGVTALPRVYVFDTSSVPDVVRGDWINEIHLGFAGYCKLGKPFGLYIDDIMRQYRAGAL